MLKTMDNTPNSGIAVVACGFVTGIVNSTTGLFDGLFKMPALMQITFSHFTVEIVKTLLLGFVGAVGAYLAKVVIAFIVKRIRLFISFIVKSIRLMFKKAK